MSKDCSLRPATPEDLEKVVEIESRVHVAAPWGLGHFQTELTKPYSSFLVLTDDETDSEIMGYIVFWLMFDECQILNVVVDLPFRGIGLAKKMVRLAINVAIKKGAKRIVLDVRKSNQAAISLYQSLEFNITRVHKNFYSNGEDAYQMTLLLSIAVK